MPIHAPNLQGGVAGTGNRQRLESVGGQFIYQLQDDKASGLMGSIVVYATNGSLTDESKWTAVGVLTPKPLNVAARKRLVAKR